MGLQCICCSSFGWSKFPHPRSEEFVRTRPIIGNDRRFRLAPKSYALPSLNWAVKVSLFPKSKEVTKVYASYSVPDAKSEVSSKNNSGIPEIHSDSNPKFQLSSKGLKFAGIELFGGKSGSVSFYGITHHVVEESKVVSFPYKDDRGSVMWVFAPLVLILSLIVPPIFLSNVFDSFLKNEYLAEIACNLSCEAVLYAGLAAFLLITDRVQRSYLHFSAKRWGLITGLKGHLSNSFFAMGLKVIPPLLVTYVTWPLIGIKALVAVSPLLVGYLAQFALEAFIDRQGSSCWPLVPIICEVYRFYQLTRAVSYCEGLMFGMRGVQATPEVMEITGALSAISVTFYMVALVCLWSLLTFFLRLFSSRPVSEKY